MIGYTQKDAAGNFAEPSLDKTCFDPSAGRIIPIRAKIVEPYANDPDHTCRIDFCVGERERISQG